MFSLLKPLLRNLASDSMQSGVKAVKDHIILWSVVLIACIFLLLFGNLTIYLLIAAKIGAIYAALILCLVWAAAFVAALSAAASLYRQAKERNSMQIASAIHRNRELIMPIALGALSLVRTKKRVITVVGAMVAGGVTAAATRLFKRKKC
ncbi:hypothetical protein [Bartonella sp. TP]|uniref:hypothetical protein n=1 Tax=Bartonella sp. TP TaxID=3057550 RepID=UPI0025B04CA0|nr:hypothetical protein [Bartonella sp. TP]WJW79628.1 hypothetical protein QVL57_03660 [Bartonella sp. TP]